MKRGDLVKVVETVEVGGYVSNSTPVWRTVPTKYMQFSRVKESLFRVSHDAIGMYIESSAGAGEVFHLVLFSSHGLGWIHDDRLTKVP